jgi:hypothetical protein
MPRLLRPLRLVAAGVAAAALVATAGPARGPQAAAAPAPPAPTATEPTDPAGACRPGDGIVVDGSMAEDLDAADGHRKLAPASGSFGAGCEPHEEEDLGWPGTGEPGPPDVDPGNDDYDDPFDRQGGLYLGYQFGADEDGGLPDYWEQPIAFRPENAAKIAQWPTVGIAYQLSVHGWTSESARTTVESTLPAFGGCRWYGPRAATEMPARVASYAPGGRPVYKYDHVAMRIGSRKFANAPGGWFHYLCGAATPSGIAGPAPGSRLSAVAAVYYLTPHWVYAEGVTADQLTRLAPIWRAARARVDGQVITSPADRSVVNLRTWMWSDARRYEITLGGQQAVVEPTGIRVVAPGVPLEAHDLRDGGCKTGGRPDVGDPAGSTDCYFRFTKANSPDPGDFYTVGLALRWKVTVRGVGRSMTFWTTRVQNYKVGEVQVPVGDGN